MSASASLSAEELTAALAQRGVVRADAEPPLNAASERPWFVSLVLGIAGWLSGVCVLFFAWSLFEPSRPFGSALMGAVMLAAAFGLYAADRANAFFDQLALALSIAGQIALGAAIGQATHSAAATAFWLAMIQCVLIVMMPNVLARFLATLFACIAWALAVRFAWWGENSFGDLQSHAVSLAPALAGWCVIWIPVAMIASVLISTEARWMASGARRILRPALGGLVLALAFGTLVSEPLDTLQFWQTARATQTNWLVLWPLLSVLAALFATLCAFRVRSTALLGAGIAAALLHVAQFYYLLGTTLLMKSAIMLMMGALMLAGGALLRRQLPQPVAEGT